MEQRFLREDFSSLNELINTINKRPNNANMARENSSQTGDSVFTGTSSYEEAINLLKFGYEKPIPDIKAALRESRKITSKLYANIPKPIPKNNVVGFIPNVPNAIMNIPKSMITVERIPSKKKVLSILYSTCTCGATPAESMIKGGVALLSAINIIEMYGISTRLQIAFMSADDRYGEFTFPTVRVKDFGEKFNLQKLCFPIVHPSMLRRIGFKYLETNPYSKGNYTNGYGHVTSFDDLKKMTADYKDTYVVTFDHIRMDLDYSIEKILEEMRIILHDK